MTFTDPAGTELHVPSDAGPDGSGAVNPGLVVTTSVPQTLIDWYGGVTPAAAMLYHGADPTVYWFDLVFSTIRVHGYVASGNVRETFREPMSADPADGAVFTVPPLSLFQSGATFAKWVDIVGALSVGGVAQGAGVAARVAAIGNPVATATTAETAIATVPSAVFAAGRAYEVIVRAQVTPAATLDVTPRIRKGTGVAGAIVVDYGRMQVQLATGGDRYFTYTGGFLTAAAVTTTLTFCVSTSAGSLPFKGFSTGPLVVEVRDIGAATDYPSLPTLA